MPLANHLVEHLVQTAEHLNQQPGRSNLNKVFRRRAISSCYYSVFQALSFVVAESFVGWGSAAEMLDPIFRLLDHKTAKSRLLSSSNLQFGRIGSIFARLQVRRHEADYAPPAHNPSRAETAEAIQEARAAIDMIDALGAAERRALAVLLIGKPR